ncbi:MAG: LysR family transcriptional regulator [Eubacteriales bacterium]|nr:LysR family transcriptional regulator [Eubacteriales bacterium]
MNLQALHYFVQVVRFQSFTRAAQECFVTQPAMSRAIRELESEMGCTLLVRANRSILMTPAGETCLAEARRILQLCDDMPEKVRRAAYEQPVRLGYLIYPHLMLFMRWFSSHIQGESPLTLDTQYASCSEAKRRFEAGELDALLLPQPCTADLKDVERCLVAASKASAIVPRGNPLFGRKELHLEELRGKKIVQWSRWEVPLLCDAQIAMCREAGFEPKIVGHGDKLGDVSALLMMKNAIGLASCISCDHNTEDIHYVPIVDSPAAFGIECVWRKENVTPQVRLLRELLQAMRARGEAPGGQDR